MEKFAVIDVGSNSVRLMVVADGKVLYKTLDTTQLGEGLAARPLLQKGAMERTAKAIARFFYQAKSEGADKVFAFATAAVRSAENRAEFLALVKTLCGVELEVVSGETEAELGILGALGEEDGGIVDIGGASTEFIVRRGGKTVYEKSVDIGVVRLKDLCGRDLSALKEAARKAIEKYGEVPREKQVYAIGGTATTLAALALDLTEYDGKKVSGYRLTRARVTELRERIAGTSVEELAARPCVPRKRAEVLLGGAVLLSELMQAFDLPAVTVSDSDNLEGYAKKKGLL
ncbi:MAG: hypothetical protein IJX81_03545 [Clostridia bacterium]|nr:hypothetical protein [Clostridia bacterium]